MRGYTTIVKLVGYTLATGMMVYDFLAHLQNLIHIPTPIGLSGIQYGTPLYELIGTVYWGLALLLFLVALLASAIENRTEPTTQPE